MNKFEIKFFKKYVPEGQEMIHIIHTHPIVILKNLIVQLVLFVILPVGLFYHSNTVIKEIPFFYFEIYLFIIFSKIIYDIFNWYNNVWIITDSSIVSVDWSFLKSKTESVNFDSIEGLGVDESGFIDKLFKKGGLMIHKIGNEEFILEEAINPYKAIDIIEEISSGKSESGNLTEERFNMLLEMLSENFKEKKDDSTYNDKKEKIKKDIIKKAENSEGTIDLR